jgi:hypothetical protein
LAVVIDTFEPRGPRLRAKDDADGLYSGKKKQHTLRSQVAVDEATGQVVDIPDRVSGPKVDITLLDELQLTHRLPEGVGD